MTRRTWEPLFRNPVSWPARVQLVLMLGVFLGGLWLAVSATLSGHLTVSGDVLAALLLAGLGRSWLWYWRRFTHNGVFVGDEGVRITAAEEQVVPWRDIAGTRIQPWGPMYLLGTKRGGLWGISDAVWIITHDGREIPLWIRMAGWTAFPRAKTVEKVRDRLDEEIRRRTDAPGDEGP